MLLHFQQHMERINKRWKKRATTKRGRNKLVRMRVTVLGEKILQWYIRLENILVIKKLIGHQNNLF